MDQFYRHLCDHADRQGFQAPQSLLLYLTDLMSKRITRTDIIPDPSFAERYLTLMATKQYHDLVDYADSCLFFTSLMPEYGHRRGLSIDYYADLGISSYYSAGDYFSDARYIQLGNWFHVLQKFLNSAVTPDVTLSLIKLYESK